MIVSHLLLILHNKNTVLYLYVWSLKCGKRSQSSRGPNIFARHCTYTTLMEILILWTWTTCHDSRWSRSLSLFGGRRHRPSSHRWSILTFSIGFVWSSFTPGSNPINYMLCISPSVSPHVLVGDCFIVCYVQVMFWCVTGFVPTFIILYILIFWVLWALIKQLRLYQVGSLPPARTLYTISIGLRLDDCGGQVIWCSTPSLSLVK